MRLFILNILLLSYSTVFANYTIADGSSINASTITAQSGVLTINGTLLVNSNVSLLNFTTVIINGPNGQIFWQGNPDLSFSSAVTITINNNAPGLQPTGGSASQRLYIGTVLIAVSNDNANNAAFSFAEFNAAGGLPQFILSVSVSTICANNSFTATITPLNNTINYDCAWSISGTGTRSPSSHSNFNTAQTTTITPSGSGSYTITCTLYKQGDGDAIVAKTKTVTVNAAPSSPSSVTSTPATICQGSPSNIKATSAGNTIQWYTVSSGGVSIGSSASAVNYSVSPAATTIYYAEAKINATGCTSAGRNSTTVTVNPTSVGGSVSGSTTVCSGSNSTLLTLSGHTGAITRWESSLNNFATAGTPIANTTINLTANNLSTATYYRAVITSGICTADNSSVAAIAISTPGTWLGANTNWNSPLNWCNGTIPTASTNVVVNNGLSYYPIITANAFTNNITVATGGSAAVTVAYAGKLKIAGAISSTNNIDATAGTIEMTGNAGQTIRADNFLSHTIGNLIITNTRISASAVSPSVAIALAGGMFNISKTLSFGNLNNAVFQTNDILTLLSGDTTASVADITNNIVNSGNTIEGKAVIERYIPGRRAWRLMTAPITAASDVSISAAWQESAVDATLGQRVNPNPGYGTHITGGPNRNSSQGFDKGPNNASIYFYDYSIDGWGVIPATTNDLFSDGKITDQQGYLLFVRGNRNTNLALATGAATSPTVLRPKGYLKQGTQPITLPAGIGFKVIGNPYASSIKFKSIYSRDLLANHVLLNNAYYLWDPRLTGTNSVGAFVAFTESATPGVYLPTVYSPNIELSSIPGDGSIQSGSAFMIRSGNGGTLDIREVDKVPANNIFSFKPAKNQMRTSLYAYNADGTLSLNDGAINFYDKRFTNEANDEEDVLKMFNLAETFALKRNNRSWCAEKRNIIEATDTIFYEMSGMRQKNYELQFAVDNMVHPNLTAYLEDTYLKTATVLDMKDTTKIKFNISPDRSSSIANRFRVVFKPLINFSKIDAIVQDDNNILLNWSVAQEQNILNYEIERSTDGIHFFKISDQQPLGSNSQGDISYDWIEANPILNQYYYYRILCIGTNHASSYSSVVKIKTIERIPSITISPNPVVDGTINISMQKMPAGTYNAALINNMGVKMLSTKLIYRKNNRGRIFIGNDIHSGIYILELIKDNKTKRSVKIIIK